MTPRTIHYLSDGSEDCNYYRRALEFAFYWTWFAVYRRHYLPTFSTRLILARLDWVTLDIL